MGQKSHRKSSIQFFTPPQQHYQMTGSSNSAPNYNKSSSYPSFASCVAGIGGASTNSPNGNAANVTPKSSSQQFIPSNSSSMFHRHSFSNISQQQQSQPPHQSPLITFSQILQESKKIEVPQPPPAVVTTSTTECQFDGPGKSNRYQQNEKFAHFPANESTAIQQHQPQQTNKDKEKEKQSIGDINSRLEFLCLQMTEQAIN